MKLLWVTPRWPFPADDGAKQATASLVLGLAGLGHEVVVVTFARERALAPSPHSRVRLLAHYRADPHGRVSRAWRTLRNLAGPLPVSSEAFAGFGLSWEMFHGEKPDAVVFDGSHGYAAFLGQPCPWPIAYRSHNNETSLWEQASRERRPRSYFRMQARRMRNFEGELGRVAAAVAAISPVDAADFQAWFPAARVGWVPMGFEFKPASPPPGTPITFGYLGRMDWPPNREGLSWFLDEVWPKVLERKPGARLKVAGSGDAGWIAGRQGFEWLGKIPAARDLYGSVHAVIAPVHSGSGTKIKVVEAVSHGRAVFATRGAFLGSGLSTKNLALLSDDVEEWVAALVGADRAALAALGAAAYEEARGLFGSRAAAEKFMSLVSGKEV